MGVKGLWKLVGPAGRPVQLESLEGQALAIDSSIWLYQFQATMRDTNGDALAGAHVLGFLRRICKLLFYGIKPVFVFDGGAPVLKRNTISERKKRKAGVAASHAKIAEKLLAAQMRREALKETTKPKKPLIDENTVFLEDVLLPRPRGSPAKPKATTVDVAPPKLPSPKKRRQVDHDPYNLPEIDLEAAVAAAARLAIPDPRLATEDELSAFIENMRPEDFDITSEAFLELPTEVKYEIIGDLRLKSRQTSHKRLQTMLRAAPTALDFSKAQIKFLQQRNNLTQQLLETTDSISNAHVNIPVRIASERNRHYVLVKNEGPEGGWVLGKRDDGTIAKPIEIDHGPNDEEDEEEMDKNVVVSQVAPDPDLRDYRQQMGLASIGVRQAPSKASRASTAPSQVSSAGRQRRRQKKPLFEPDEDDEDPVQPAEVESDDPELDIAIAESLEAEQLRQAQELSSSLLLQAGSSKLTLAGAINSMSGFVPPSVAQYDNGSDIDDMYVAYSHSPAAPATSARGSSGPPESSSAFGPALFLTETQPVAVLPPKVRVPAAAPLPVRPATPPQLGSRFSIATSRDSHYHRSTRSASSQPAPGPSSLCATAPDSLATTSVLEAALATDDEDTDEGEEDTVNLEEVAPPVLPAKQQVFEDDEDDDMEEVAPSSQVAALDVPTPGGHDEDEDMEEVEVEPQRKPSSAQHVNEDEDLIEVEAEDDFIEVVANLLLPQPAPEPVPVSVTSETDDVSHAESTPLDQLPHQAAEVFDEHSSPSSSPIPVVGDEPAAEHEEDEHWDAAQEMDPQAEESGFAEFLSQVKGRDLNAVRQEIDAEIDELNKQRRAAQRDSDDITQQMTSQIMVLLRLFGIPYMTAPMEAEAQCAALVELGLVDGVITDDSDVFLFGSPRVFKNMFNQSKTVECFFATDLVRDLGLDRDKLIRLAYLPGSDYVDGVPGVGPVMAMELLEEFPGDDGLHKFKEWWLKVQSGKDKPEDTNTAFRKRFKKKFKTLHISDEWPNPVVRDAYYHPTIDDSDEQFKWGLPDLDALQHFLGQELSWPASKVDDLVLPVIHKMGQRSTNNASKQTDLTSYFNGGAGAGAANVPRKKQAYASKRLQKIVSDYRKERKAKGVTPGVSPSPDIGDSGTTTTEGSSASAKRKRKTNRANKSTTPAEEEFSGPPTKKKRTSTQRKRREPADEDSDGEMRGSISTDVAPQRKSRPRRGAGTARTIVDSEPEGDA